MPVDANFFSSGLYAIDNHQLFKRLELHQLQFDSFRHPDAEMADDNHYPAVCVEGDFREHDVFVVTEKLRPYIISRVAPQLGEAVLVHIPGIISHQDVWIGDDEVFAERVRSLADFIYGPLWELATRETL